MLHIGEPHEVKAAAAAFAGALATVIGQVAGTAERLNESLPRRRDSELDRQLTATHDDAIVSKFVEAIGALVRHTPEIEGRTKYAVNELQTQDIIGGAKIRRHEA
ncbi:hypothetical protein ACFQZZ_24365 [Nocardia sp. GCM10030253]|uniref:hypothetical protein n=1 Tax=Nocardia sp. GCM10030253 TaxID=3273404 RepID=UPI00362EDEC3